MEIYQVPAKMIDALRAIFHPKDRSVVLAPDTFIEGAEIVTPGNPASGRGRLYYKDGCWHQLNSSGVEESLCNGTWQSWTPVVTQSGNVTVTVTYAEYVAIGDTIHLQARLDVTGSGTAANAVVISGIPAAVQPADNGGGTTAIPVVGTGLVFDAGTAYYIGALLANGADDLRIVVHNSGAVVGADPNFGLANGDIISFQATYRRA